MKFVNWQIEILPYHHWVGHPFISMVVLMMWTLGFGPKQMFASGYLNKVMAPVEVPETTSQNLGERLHSMKLTLSKCCLNVFHWAKLASYESQESICRCSLALTEKSSSPVKMSNSSLRRVPSSSLSFHSLISSSFFLLFLLYIYPTSAQFLWMCNLP